MFVNHIQEVGKEPLCILAADVGVVIPIFWIQVQLEMFKDVQVWILEITSKPPGYQLSGVGVVGNATWYLVGDLIDIAWPVLERLWISPRCGTVSNP